MVEPSGQSAAALDARRSALAQRHAEVAEADRMLAEAANAAHTITVESLAALDRIEAEIASAVAAHSVDAGPAEARELQRLLIAKQREILDMVTRARDQAHEKAAAVQELTEVYHTSV